MLMAIAGWFGVPSLLHVHGSDFDTWYLAGNPELRQWVRRQLARAKFVVALSESWRAFLSRITVTPLAVVHNAVNTREIHPHRVGRRDDVPTLLFLGLVGRRKGVPELLRAVRELAHAERPCQVRVVIAGNGEVQLTQRVVEDCRLRGLVDVRGWIGPEEKTRCLLDADIFVLPSHHEGLPMSLLEAMAAGLAVITTPVGGIPEVIEDEKNGLMVPPGNVDALADAIRRLVADRKLRERLAAAGRTTVEERFDIRVAAARFKRIYERLAPCGVRSSRSMPANDFAQDDIAGVLNALAGWIIRNGDAGTDPYDALNSPLAPTARLLGRWGRIGFLQLAKRMPGRLRGLLFIPPGVNPKAMGLLTQAFLVFHRSRGGDGYLHEAIRRLEWLKSHAVRSGGGIGWGYHFDWAARAFFVPKGTPTVVNTSVIARAFLLAHELTGEADYLGTARQAARFVLTLNRTETSEGLCFSYTPLDRSMVLNASLMGASLLAQVGSALGGDEECLKAARSATDFVLAHQADDGSWPYGLAPHHRWTDGHHTGFVLRDLGEIRRATGWDHLDGPIRRGMAFYAGQLVTEDGRALSRLDRPWPADIHACAEAMLVFTDPNLQNSISRPLERALGVARWTIGRLRRPDGAFGYMAYPNCTDWTPHLRWGEAWMLLALARLEEALLRVPVGR